MQLVVGWNTTQPGCLRDACFPLLGSITLGNASSGGHTAIFNSVTAIDNFLPAGGSPGVFTKNYINPTSTSAGNFAGQLLAAMLNVAFSGNDFSHVFFKNCSSVSPLFQGLSVAQVIYISNQVIAGLDGFPGFTPALLTQALSVFNGAFDGCKQNSNTTACFFCTSLSTLDDEQETDVPTNAPQSQGIAIFIGIFVGVMLFLIVVTCIASRNSKRSNGRVRF
jgi:hypothetical protein